MTRTGIRAFAILLAGALCTATTLAAGTERQLISAADFGALPFMVGPKMSPDAKHVVTTAHLKGKKLLVILDLGPKTGPSHSFTMPGKWELGWYRWAGNERVLVSIGHADVLFGDDVYVTRLVMYDLKTDKAAFIGKKNEGVEGDNVIHIDRDGHWLLLNVQKTIYDYPSVYRVDLDTMDMKKVVSEHPHVWNWFADSSGTVRAGVGVEGRRWWLLYRKEADAKFEKVMRRTVKSTDDDEGVIERSTAATRATQSPMHAPAATACIATISPATRSASRCSSIRRSTSTTSGCPTRTRSPRSTTPTIAAASNGWCRA